ncbi:MAG: fibronectin type III domain-containing protein [Cyclobacteriaceae bacterium]|nr:MAG: fibronectin type III domain-containing protein [Cyclobacteriaceae bacterium]
MDRLMQHLVAAGYLVLRKAGSPNRFTLRCHNLYRWVGNWRWRCSFFRIINNIYSVGINCGYNLLLSGFSYNGTGQSLNYRTTSPLSNSTITIPSNPTAISASGVAQTSFTANWNSSVSATSYRLDVSPDNFSTFVSGYNNRTVTGVSESVSGLNPNTTYKYRVRAINASGASGNSNEISQITVTSTPVAIAATSPSQTGFTANWNIVAGATGYKIDVSDNTGFSTFVTNFSNKDVTGTTTSVTGLNSGVTYYYRVRSYNSVELPLIQMSFHKSPYPQPGSKFGNIAITNSIHRELERSYRSIQL